MMGHRQVERAALFYEFSLERHIPADHWLRSIDRFIELGGLRRLCRRCKPDQSRCQSAEGDRGREGSSTGSRRPRSRRILGCPRRCCLRRRDRGHTQAHLTGAKHALLRVDVVPILRRGGCRARSMKALATRRARSRSHGKGAPRVDCARKSRCCSRTSSEFPSSTDYDCAGRTVRVTSSSSQQPPRTSESLRN